MKLIILFCSASILLFFTTGCQRKENESENKEELSVINLTDVNNEPVDFTFSDLVDEEFEIIPLETRPDILVGRTWEALFTKNFLLLDNSIHSTIPGKVYRFDNSGKFINELSRGGKGPGEHIGNLAYLRYFEKSNQVQMIWRGQYGFEEPQLFSPEGEFLRQVHTPFRNMTNVERLSDSIWFSVGLGETGPAFRPIDSLRMIFFSADGTIIKSIPRRAYPKSIIEKNMPTMIMGKSAYATEGKWKFVLQGVDTLFRIDNLNMIPEAVFREPVTENPPLLDILAETNANLFFRRTIESNIRFEQTDDGRVLRSDRKDEFIILDKVTGVARSVKLNDDIFHAFSELTNPFQIQMQILKWTPDGRVYMIIPAADFIQIRDKMKSGNITPSVSEKLKILDGIGENDNPVIFLFSLKKHVTIE